MEFPGYPGLQEQPPQLPQIYTFWQQAHNEHFDLAIQLHGSGTITNPLILSEEDKQQRLAVDEVCNLGKGEYVCVHPGASTPMRCWQPKGFASVADAIAHSLGLRVVLTGSKQEDDQSSLH